MTETVKAHPEVLEDVLSVLKTGITEGKSYQQLADELQVKYPQYPLSRRTLNRLHISYLRGQSPEIEVSINIDGKTLGEVVSEELVQDSKTLALQDKANTYKRKYTSVLRTLNITDELIQEIKPLLQHLPPTPLSNIPLKEVGATGQDVVGLLSCLHFGEVVEYSQTMGAASYNSKIAAARVQQYVEAVINLVRQRHKGDNIKNLWLVSVGDLISGSIHQELEVTNEFPLGEQIVRCAYLLSMAVRDLAAHFEKIHFIGVTGNHARFEKKPPFKNRYNNGDYLIYHMMQGLLADQKNVDFNIPKSPWITQEIEGHAFFFAHGDNIRSTNGFPWNDVNKYTTSMTQVLTRQGLVTPRYWCFGQFHQINMAQLSYGEYLFTASFKGGGDEYSLGKIRAGTDAAQLLFGVHKEQGVTFRYPINLTKVDTDKLNRYACVSDSNWSPSPQ